MSSHPGAVLDTTSVGVSGWRPVVATTRSRASLGCSTPTTANAGDSALPANHHSISAGRRSTTSYSKPVNPRLRLRLSVTTSICAAMSGTLDDVADDCDARGTDDNDEQRWEDAEDEREKDLHRHLLSLLLRPLGAFDTHLGGLDPQHVGNRHAERVRLHHRRHESPKLGDRRPFTEGSHSVRPSRADLHLLKDAEELLGQWAGRVARHLGQRGIETEACLDGDRQQVEGVGQVLLDLCLAGL